MPDYPWYGTVSPDAALSQGEIIDRCPVFVPVSASDMRIDSKTPRIRGTLEYYSVIVMSQSCDLEHGNVDLVLVCPIWPLPLMAQRNLSMFRGKGVAKLRSGDYPGYHLVNKCSMADVHRDLTVVDFHNVYGVPLEFLQEHVKGSARLQLLPPYREHLAQAFARFFMRVGLPTDIDIASVE